MNKTKLTPEQIEQLNDLIANTILPALQEDICIPENEDEDVDIDQMLDLMDEAIKYLKNNI